jgi:hypothetical protein
MPGIDFARLRAEITMEQVLDRLGFEPVACWGEQLHGPCPVHGSSWPRSRTFSVNLRKRRYYCHKCHSHGNPDGLADKGQAESQHPLVVGVPSHPVPAGRGGFQLTHSTTASGRSR